MIAKEKRGVFFKRASADIGIGVKKIFDANYGEVNTYHVKAWEAAYPELEL